MTILLHVLSRLGLVFVFLALAGPAAAQTGAGSGTGFFVNEGGWVLTSRDVVEGCEVVEVVGHGRPSARLTDPDANLALLHLRGARVPQPLPLRDSPARLAEDVVALGFPLTETLGGAIRATIATVRARAGLRDDPRYIQISAALRPGSSGGPVLDRAGHVVGIAEVMPSDPAPGHAENIGFAITAAEARRFMAGAGIAGAAAAAPATVADASLPDRVEAAAAATVLIVCTRATGTVPPDIPPAQGVPDGMPQADPTPEPVAQPYTRDGMVFRPGEDVLGFDLRGVRGVTLQRCEDLCGREDACVAFTWTEADRICFLKGDATLIVRAPGAIAAHVERLSNRVVPTGQTIDFDTGTDAPAYDRFGPSSLTGCFAACGLDPLCRAFSYRAATRSCALHAATSLVRSSPGVYLGRK